MKNCFNFSLKDNINNPSLPKFGVIQVPVKAGQSITVGVAMGLKVELAEGNATATQGGSTVNLPANSADGAIVVTAVTDCIVHVSDKYELSTIPSGTNWDVDTKVFEYSPITLFNVQEANKIHGDIKYLIHDGNTNLLVSLETNTITGDFAEIGKCLNVTTIGLAWNRTVTGSIEGLVRMAVSKGRTTGTISVGLAANIVTFNGQYIPYTGGSGKTLSWQPNSVSGKTDVTFDGTTITIDNII